MCTATLPSSNCFLNWSQLASAGFGFKTPSFWSLIATEGLPGIAECRQYFQTCRFRRSRRFWAVNAITHLGCRTKTCAEGLPDIMEAAVNCGISFQLAISFWRMVKPYSL